MLCVYMLKIFSFWWLEDSVGNIAKPVPSNPQNSRNLGFETGEPLLSVVVGVPSGDVALDRIDRASKETNPSLVPTKKPT